MNFKWNDWRTHSNWSASQKSYDWISYKIMILEVITCSFSGKSSFEYKPTKKNDCLVLVASIVACREEP